MLIFKLLMQVHSQFQFLRYFINEDTVIYTHSSGFLHYSVILNKVQPGKMEGVLMF